MEGPSVLSLLDCRQGPQDARDRPEQELGPSQRPGHGGDRMDIFAVPQADTAAASIASALGSVSGRRAQKCQQPDTLMKSACRNAEIDTGQHPRELPRVCGFRVESREYRP
jgi:hypothetical protein